MDNKKQEKDISNSQFGGDEISHEYKFLFHKLKSIREIINMLQKNFLEKDI